MATPTVGNLDENLLRRLRLRAAQNGRSAEAEHRDILRSILVGGGQVPTRDQVAERLAEFRRRTAGRGSAPSAELLDASRTGRIEGLAHEAAGIRDQPSS